MISLKCILESKSYTNKFTFKQRDAVGVIPSYQNTKVVKGVFTTLQNLIRFLSWISSKAFHL
jgi:hypothetical protein